MERLATVVEEVRGCRAVANKQLGSARTIVGSWLTGEVAQSSIGEVGNSR